MTSPANSAGLRTSTRASSGSPRRGRMSSRKARRAKSGSGRLVAARGIGRDVGRQRQAVVEPVLAAAVEDPDVAVAEQLELPVGPGGEPVVVVAVQDDRGVGPDARRATGAALKSSRAGDVAADAVGELAGPVPADRARAGGSARRRSCRRRPRRSGRSGRRGGSWPSRRRRGRRWRSRGRSWLSPSGVDLGVVDRRGQSGRPHRWRDRARPGHEQQPDRWRAVRPTRVTPRSRGRGG